MKIAQLINGESRKTYHESLARQIPRGIQTQEEIFSVGYSLAVRELGLNEAQNLDTKFAANLLACYYQQHLHEGLGNLIGKGIGKVAGAVGSAVGNVKGAWQGAKDAYSQNRDRMQPVAQRNVARAGNATPAKPTPAPAQSSTPATGGGYTQSGEVGSNNLLARAQQGTTQDPNAQPAAPAAQPAAAAEPAPAAPTEPVAQTPAPAAQEPVAEPAAEPAAAGPMSSSEIVKDLQDVWNKATADQGSKTSSPAVQQQLLAMAKAAALTGRTVESKRNKSTKVVEFKSRFLGMMI